VLDIDKGFYMPGWGSLPGRLRRWPLLIDRGGSPFVFERARSFFLAGAMGLLPLYVLPHHVPIWYLPFWLAISCQQKRVKLAQVKGNRKRKFAAPTRHLGANKKYASKTIYFTIKKHTLLSFTKCRSLCHIAMYP